MFFSWPFLDSWNIMFVCLTKHIIWHTLSLVVYWLLHAFLIISFTLIALTSPYIDKYKIDVLSQCVLQGWPSHMPLLVRQSYWKLSVFNTVCSALKWSISLSISLLPEVFILVNDITIDSFKILVLMLSPPKLIQLQVLFTTSIVAFVYTLTFSHAEGTSVDIRLARITAFINLVYRMWAIKTNICNKNCLLLKHFNVFPWC